MTTGDRFLPLAVLLVCLALSCGDPDPSEQRQTSSQQDSKNGGPNAPANPHGDAPRTPGNEAPATPPGPGSTPAPPETPAPPCTPPESVSNDPRSIEDAIALINALPMPVTLKCYLEVLQRPLRLNATSSRLSVQTPADASSPRMFLFSGSLVTSFVPEGEGSHLLEFSVLLSSQSSIKGEIAFPVRSQLAADAAYEGALRAAGSGTRCSGCHFDEGRAPGVASDKAYSSRALRPFARYDVPLATVEQASAACEYDNTARCQILRAVFGQGDVEAQAFPADMPTMF